MSDLPDWVRKYKANGVETRVSGQNYYAYKMTQQMEQGEEDGRQDHREVSGCCDSGGIVKPRSLAACEIGL